LKYNKEKRVHCAICEESNFDTFELFVLFLFYGDCTESLFIIITGWLEKSSNMEMLIATGTVCFVILFFDILQASLTSSCLLF
jgi:hypothetical protein